MRPRYPLSKKETEVELSEIQEHLIYVLGVDKFPHDGVIEVSGQYDILDNDMDQAISGLITNRIIDPVVSASGSSYASVYSAVTRERVGRKIDGK